ncbi:hypothetical protein [Paraburkholderia sp. D1E]
MPRTVAVPEEIKRHRAFQAQYLNAHESRPVKLDATESNHPNWR